MAATAPGVRRRGVALVVASTLGVVLATAGCSSDPTDSPSTTAAPTSTTTSAFGPAPAVNPHLGPSATSTMHADSGSSDSTPLPGPGTGPIEVRSIDLGAVCPTILIGSDEIPVALCTRISDLRPVVHLLDPDTGASQASTELTASGLFGGVYGYLDDQDRMVMVDGGDLVRISHRRGAEGWLLEPDDRVPLGTSVPPGDHVTSIAPDHSGGVWFATDGGVVGLVHDDGRVTTTTLSDGERVSNSISTSPVGMAVATDHALYLVTPDGDDGLEVRWRVAYDRGPARKPGLLAWGTGSTPTFFGPTDGADFVAIIDNAEPQVHLVVVRTSGDDAGQVVCTTGVLAQGGPGSENSPIGIGRTVVVASTYGYAYPRVPDDAGPSTPATAPFTGGMTRAEVRADGSGCDVVWDTTTRSAAVPRLSTADGMITTVIASPARGGDETYEYGVIDAADGTVVARRALGDVADPLQLAGTVGPGRALWQGTIGAVLRISPRSARGS